MGAPISAFDSYLLIVLKICAMVRKDAAEPVTQPVP
jgi:hypothetical protein